MARAKPDAEATYIEADDGLEPFERPVPVVKPGDPVPEGNMMVRVLPKGAGKIATGHFDRPANAFTYHDKGAHLILPEKIAKAQEDAGLLEIVNGD